MVRRILGLPLLFMSFVAMGQDIVLNVNGLRAETKRNGYSAKEVDYFDDKGNAVLTVTYDRNEKPEATPYGVAIIERKFDSKGNLIERKFYDQNRKLFRTEFTGPAIEKFKYDDKRNLIETIYCDEKGLPLKGGLAIVTAKHDARGNVIEERHFDHNRKLTEGTCMYRYQYDSMNRKIEESRFDRTGALVKVKGTDGAAITRYSYDQKDRVVEVSYFNEDNKLCDGIAFMKFNYDKKPEENPPLVGRDSQWVEQVYFDKMGSELKRDFKYLPKTKDENK